MKSAIEQSIKEKIKVLAKERESTFTELWRNLILERFLTRLAMSPYKNKFILKGGHSLQNTSSLEEKHRISISLFKSFRNSSDTPPSSGHLNCYFVSFVLRNLKAFTMTETELKLIAKAAIIGLSNKPVKG